MPSYFLQLNNTIGFVVLRSYWLFPVFKKLRLVICCGEKVTPGYFQVTYARLSPADKGLHLVISYSYSYDG